jgi:hypothetical protein
MIEYIRACVIVVRDAGVWDETNDVLRETKLTRACVCLVFDWINNGLNRSTESSFREDWTWVSIAADFVKALKVGYFRV